MLFPRRGQSFSLILGLRRRRSRRASLADRQQRRPRWSVISGEEALALTQLADSLPSLFAPLSLSRTPPPIPSHPSPPHHPPSCAFLCDLPVCRCMTHAAELRGSSLPSCVHAFQCRARTVPCVVCATHCVQVGAWVDAVDTDFLRTLTTS